MNEPALKYPPVPVNNLTPEISTDRELQYILNLHNGQDHLEAGTNAGYSYQYVRGELYRKRYKSTFLQRYIEVTKCSFAYLISKVLRLDTKYVDKLSDEADQNEWDNYAKSYRTLERISKLSGFMKSDHETTEVTININQVQNMLLNKHK